MEVDPHATSMITESLTAHEIRAGIIADTKAFLIGLESGATNDQLRAFLQRIREKEIHLLKVGGDMLDPKIWTILHNRLAQRDGQEVIDNTDPASGSNPGNL
jgi:predicted HAD superfamily phosphohydrolase YqeG